MANTQAKNKAQVKSKSKAKSVTEHAAPSAAVVGAESPASAAADSGDKTAQRVVPKTVYCTIAASNYLHRALLLRDSIVAVQGPVDFRLLVVEHPAVVARLRSQLPDVTLIAPDEIGCPQWLQMAFYYDVMEYATALKAALVRTLLRAGNVVYLDPDIEVFSPLRELESALNDADVVLTPHVTALLPDDGLHPSMQDILRKGQFNLGFLGVGQSAAAEELLGWWQDMLVENALASDADGLFTDQMWAAAFASAAPRLKILRSAQYNLAYWNVGQSGLQWEGSGVPTTKDGPLIFFHYSGLDPAAIEKVSRYQTRVTAPSGSPLNKLLTQYLDKLAHSKYKEFATLPYSFAAYTNGLPIPKLHRRIFWRLPRPNRKAIYNPFAESQYFTQLASDYTEARCPHCAEQDARFQRLPYSLIGYAGKALEILPGGVRERLYDLMQTLSDEGGSARSYARRSFDLILPGGRDNLYNALKEGTTSNSFLVRQTAKVMLGVAGARS